MYECVFFFKQHSHDENTKHGVLDLFQTQIYSLLFVSSVIQWGVRFINIILIMALLGGCCCAVNVAILSTVAIILLI